jgi:hypothetical protein
MERYMLTKEDGPLYESLYDPRPVSRDRLDQLAGEYGRSLKLTGVRIPSYELARIRGPNWALLPAAGRLQRLAASAGGIRFEGEGRWPYRPFGPIEGELSAASPGAWIERRIGDEVFIAYVRSVEQRRLPPLALGSEGFQRVVQRWDRERVRFERRTRLLQEASFEFHPVLAEDVLSKSRRLPYQRIGLPSDVSFPGLSSVLATYVDNGILVKVTPAEWAEYHNSLLMRRAPTSVPSLEDSVKDMVVEQMDVEEARRRGFDQTPRFSEDRRNFTYYQVLDIFEKDALVPTVSIGCGEIAAYYRDHPDLFTRKTSARVQVLVFDDEDSARGWRGGEQIKGSVSQEPGRVKGLKSHTDLDVSPGRHAISDVPVPAEILLEAPPGRVFGPIPSSKGAVVLVKRSDQTTRIPLTQVASEVRAEILRRKLDEREVQLAGEWAAQFHVEDRIPYEKFGLQRPPGGSMIAAKLPKGS